MRGFRALAVGLSLMLQACSSGQQGAPPVSVYQNDGTFRKTSIPGVFSVQPDGSAVHVQSGFVCPAAFPNATLLNLQSFPSEAGLGTDVGCDYARVDSASGRIASKFTIFLVKARPDTTLEQEFARYQSQMHGYNRPEKIGGEVFQLGGEAAPKYPPMKSEEDEIRLYGHLHKDELVVSIVNGWVIELRSTYPAEFLANDPAATKDIVASAAIWAITVGAFMDSHKK
jgi:hypothetical protein